MSKAGRLWEPYGGAELLTCHLQNAKAVCRSVLDKPHRAFSSCARKYSLPADRSLRRAGDIVMPACNVSYMSVPELATSHAFPPVAFAWYATEAVPLPSPTHSTKRYTEDITIQQLLGIAGTPLCLVRKLLSMKQRLSFLILHNTQHPACVRRCSTSPRPRCNATWPPGVQPDAITSTKRLPAKLPAVSLLISGTLAKGSISVKTASNTPTQAAAQQKIQSDTTEWRLSSMGEISSKSSAIEGSQWILAKRTSVESPATSSVTVWMPHSVLIEPSALVKPCASHAMPVSTRAVQYRLLLRGAHRADVHMHPSGGSFCGIAQHHKKGYIAQHARVSQL
jgi:hypothetical protein